MLAQGQAVEYPNGLGSTEQNPDLITSWIEIWRVKEEHRKTEERKKKNKQSKKG